ncbi:two-component sensor histidine kinase [Pyxidicoccus parkwayensis]|uniref:histidine kinase n=1 Tax=Pyxidicoccus parkwayensis TaxID=2813578 RepID=A0ABX7NT15_9BACT|nr:ATP-binding protein [Pyxidicoccus parkwaysis]QSQ20680.1 two-component sensor histidine kinase [Pyxidicoccus parkwaysis]
MRKDATSELDAHLRLRRRNLLLCAAVLALAGATHPLTLGRVIPEVLAVHAAWSAIFVVLGFAVGRRWLRSQVSGGVAALVALGALMLDIRFTGGLASPFFPGLYAVPLIVAVFTPGHRQPTLVACALTLVALLVMCAWSGATPQATLAQVFSFAFVAWVSAYGGRTFRRLRDAERDADRERVEALQRLAESERLRAQGERNRAEMERLAVVGKLAAGVAHEVNNPLAFVKSNLGFLEEELAEPAPDVEELRRVLEETRQGVQRIQQIVADLRRFSRDAVDSDERCAAGDAVEEAGRLASVRLRSLGEVVVDVAPELPPVRISQRHLVQVLVNLLLNAADAVDTAEPRRAARIVVRASAAEAGVRLDVEDNGPGIPESVLPRLFEPFFTTKPPGKGTGLGLALCREYVARAGGTLAAENRAEGGARFTLCLPAATGTAKA